MRSRVAGRQSEIHVRGGNGRRPVLFRLHHATGRIQDGQAKLFAARAGELQCEFTVGRVGEEQQMLMPGSSSMLVK